MRLGALLEARGASLCYRGPRGVVTAVRRASCRVRPGEWWAVTGPSGHGKSSLLYLLSALRLASAGRVTFRGHEYRRLSRARLADLRRENFGFVFQEPFLVPYLTCLENVLVGGRGFAAAAGLAAAEGGAEALRHRAEEMLRRLGVGEVGHRFPHQLSGGQRQRVSLARALLGAPAVLFADEPTASLDRASAGLVAEALEEYRRQGGTVVLVSHDPLLLGRADSVTEMREGILDSPSP